MTSSSHSPRAVRGVRRSLFQGAVVGACITMLTFSVAAAQQPATSRPATAPATATSSQVTRTVKADTPDATRAELTQLLDETRLRATDAKLSAADRSRAQTEVTEISRRLEGGDFQAGDRFSLTITADSLRRMDVLVREGPSIDFGTLGALPIGGVLRAELPAVVQRHFGKYYRNVEVKADYLTRITITGAVAKPGSYYVPPFVLVADVLSQTAGGLASVANPDQIVVRRGTREVVSAKEYRGALEKGLTVEQLGIQAGDEIRVAERKRRNARELVMVGMFTVSIFTAVLALIRSSYAE